MTFLKYRQNEKQSEEFSSIEWLTTQAVVNHKEGKLEEAIAFYLEAIELDENQPAWVYGNVITVMAQIDHLNEGLKLGEKALKSYPESDEIHRALGNLFRAQGNPENSANIYLKAIQLKAEQPEWLYSHVISGLIKTDISLASKIGFIGVELYPQSEWINYHLGEALALQQNWEEALFFYTKASKLSSSLPEIQNKLNSVSRQLARFKEIDSLSVAVKKTPQWLDKEEVDDSLIDVFLFPDYRQTNSYQSLLYSHCQDNISIYAGNITKAFEHIRKTEKKVVFHLHWTSPILAKATSYEEAETLKNDFIDKLINFFYEGGYVIWTIHNTLPHDCQFVEQEIALRNSICSIANKIHIHSKKSISEITKVFNLPLDKTCIIHHGNYVQENQNYVPRNLARKKFNFSSENIVYLFLGQIRPYKGINELFSAFTKLQKQYTQIYLLIAGKPIFPIMEGSISKRAKLFPNITVIEKHLDNAELQWFFNAADIVVLPYTKTLTSGSVLNALSFSRPVIAPKVGMIEEIVKDGNNGFLYELNSVSGLYKAMEKALFIEQHKQKLFKQSFKSIENLTWTEASNKLLSNLCSAIKYIDISIETESVRCKIWNPIEEIKVCKVAIIILNYCCIEDTIKLVESIEKSQFVDFNIIIVDNNSPNLTFKNLIDKFKKYTIIKTPKNLGYAAGNNVAVKYVEDKQFDYTWILNPDTIVEPNSLSELVNAAKIHKNISIFGSVICWGHKPDTIWFAGGQVQTKTTGICISHMYGGQDVNLIPESIYEVDYVTGASIFCSSQLFQEIGLIPEQYFLYFEETDWCLNARKKGHKIAVVPSCKIYHHKRSQIGALPQKYYFYYYIRGSILFMLKYFSQNEDLIKNSIYDNFINPWLEKIGNKAPKQLGYFQALAEKAVEHGISQVAGKVNLLRIFSDNHFTSQLADVLEGSLEVVSQQEISGWIMNKSQPMENIEVKIFVDDNEYRTVVANEYRQELEQQGYGTGNYGFKIAFPSSLRDMRKHKIEAIVENYKLSSKSENIVCFDSLTPLYKGRIDGIDDLQVKGWALDINNPEHILDVEILDGESVIVKTQSNILRPDLVKVGFNTSVGGFCIPIPIKYCDGNRHNLSLKIVETKEIISTRSVLMSIKEHPKIVADSLDNFWRLLYHHRVISMIHPENRDSIYLEAIENNKEKLVEKYIEGSQNYLVSIIMPVYNRENTIIDAIKSVERQKYTNWELLIADDGSQDDTVQVVRKIIDNQSENKIKLIQLNQNFGVSKARNEALKQSCGDIIAYLDSDNSWDSNFLLIMVNVLLENKWAKLVYCGDKIWQSYPKNTTLQSKSEVVSMRLGHFNKSLIENRNYIDLNVFIHWREIYEKLGGFREDMRRLVDWELILRYTDFTTPKFVPAFLVDYYMGRCNNQITKTEDYVQNLLKFQETLEKLGNLI
jgi:GT2 family glycosyltransferase/glycosyltransferase involved in cell wall biosynthesis